MVSQQLKSFLFFSLFLVIANKGNVEARTNFVRKERDLATLTTSTISEAASPNYQDSDAEPFRVEITNALSEEPIVAEPFSNIPQQQQQQQGIEPSVAARENDDQPIRLTIVDTLLVADNDIPQPDQVIAPLAEWEQQTWDELIGYDVPAEPFQAQQRDQESDTQTITNPLQVIETDQGQDNTNNEELLSDQNTSPFRPVEKEEDSTSPSEISSQRLRGQRPSSP